MSFMLYMFIEWGLPPLVPCGVSPPWYSSINPSLVLEVPGGVAKGAFNYSHWGAGGFRIFGHEESHTPQIFCKKSAPPKFFAKNFIPP